MNFATNLAAPFFAVYMLQDLGFSYFTYVIVNASAALATFLSLNFWGKRADQFGNRSALILTSCLIPFIPLLWILDQHLYWLIPVQLLWFNNSYGIYYLWVTSAYSGSHLVANFQGGASRKIKK